MAQDPASDIDAETWAFIRRSESFYPADTAGVGAASVIYFHGGGYVAGGAASSHRPMRRG